MHLFFNITYKSYHQPNYATKNVTYSPIITVIWHPVLVSHLGCVTNSHTCNMSIISLRLLTFISTWKPWNFSLCSAVSFLYFIALWESFLKAPLLPSIFSSLCRRFSAGLKSWIITETVSSISFQSFFYEARCLIQVIAPVERPKTSASVQALLNWSTYFALRVFFVQQWSFLLIHFASIGKMYKKKWRQNSSTT